MTLSEYTRLKQDVVLSFANNENHTAILNVLKEFYKDDIDSKRRFEKICTIVQLLKTLEIRDILSEDDIGPLKEIARKLNSTTLLRKICDYERNHIPRENINYYATQNKTDTPKNEAFNNSFGNMSKKKERRIEETLVEEIGIYWRDLARNLKIREGKIDKIDTTFHTLEEKTKEILKTYRDICDPNKWFFVLCDALEKSRRRDLSRSLQEIMTMNI